MTRLINFFLLAIGGLLWSSCSDSQEVKIAVLADVHLHDIYATLSDVEFENAPVDGDNRNLLLRPMAEQLRSTRVYNENYFAFIAALDDIVSRGVDYVIMPGDFSDDGQVNNIVALRNILSGYSQKYGVEFFITTGNHDPVRPFTRSDVAINFLNKDGGKERFYGSENRAGGVVSRDVQHLGYEGIVNNLSSFGFLPQPSYLYWESPYSSHDYASYNFEDALAESSISNREYAINQQGVTLPDASYLVEPVEGLWLLAIDANAYPFTPKFEDEPRNPLNFGSPSSGYVTTLEHKKELFKWVESVAQRAKALDKRLISFSHYPVVDFFDTASADVARLLGEDKMQLGRNPDGDVADIFADAGIKLHFAGHMHIDDVGEHTTAKGNKIVNVQVPSIAGYSPGYKIMSLKDGVATIESVTIDDVPNFDVLFPFYEQEYQYLLSSGEANLWSRDILASTSYREFITYHLHELVRLRFIPSWQHNLDEESLSMSGAELLRASGVNEEIENIEQYEQFTTFDVIFDFYRLYAAGAVGAVDVGEKRLKVYDSMLSELRECKSLTPSGELISALLGIVSHFQEEGLCSKTTVDIGW
ncbi:MAG: metallophosphoesterase [Rikenellaceae bacterium]